MYYHKVLYKDLFKESIEMSLRTMCCICVNLNINQSSMPLLLTNFMILAWLVHNMSTHGGEETWPMTLKSIYTNWKTRNQIPEY